MIKKMVKLGNSYALVIDRTVMKLLAMSPDTPLELTTDGRVLVLSPVRATRRKSRLGKAISGTSRRFNQALRKPAK